jgi:hypothetical protein
MIMNSFLIFASISKNIFKIIINYKLEKKINEELN